MKKKNLLKKHYYLNKTYYLVNGVSRHPTSSIVVVVWQATPRVIQFCQGTPHCGPSIGFIFFFLAVGILFLSISFFSFPYKLVKHGIYFHFFSSLLLPVLVQYLLLLLVFFEVFLAAKQLHFFYRAISWSPSSTFTDQIFLLFIFSQSTLNVSYSKQKK